VTAVDRRGEIDVEGTLRVANWLVAKGVDGIFVAGTTGRFADFPPEQSAILCQALAKAKAESTTVYGGICDSGVGRMLANAGRMKDAGAQVVVATGPYYLSRLQEERENDMLRLATYSPLPLMVYDIPEFVGYTFRPEWIAQMADHENVIGYKDSSDDIVHHREVLDRTRGKEFSVLIGKELLLADAFQAGASGLVVSLIHADPEPFVSLAAEAARRNWDGAKLCQERVREVVREFRVCYDQRPVFSTLLQYLERKLNERGLQVRLC
jgi:4-hydroxy-tetrahydrodipicolinate synthase